VKKLLLILMMLATAALVTADQAQEIKVDGGLIDFTAAPCGNWYQCNQPTLPYTLRLIQPAVSIGVFTEKSDDWQFGVGVGDDRRATVDATIKDVDGCKVLSKCGPSSQMQGQGMYLYRYAEARRYFGDAFIGLDFVDSRTTYWNCNGNWYGGQDFSVGPVKSCVKYQPKNIPGWGLTAGYEWGAWYGVFRVLPTAANNSQPDAQAPGGTTWYRPITSSSIGFSPYFGLGRTF